jgi:hypothetical protein
MSDRPHEPCLALRIAGNEILRGDIVVPVDFHLGGDVDIAPVLLRNNLLIAQPMLRGDEITGKAMRGRDVHAIDHA